MYGDVTQLIVEAVVKSFERLYEEDINSGVCADSFETWLADRHHTGRQGVSEIAARSDVFRLNIKDLIKRQAVPLLNQEIRDRGYSVFLSANLLEAHLGPCPDTLLP